MVEHKDSSKFFDKVSSEAERLPFLDLVDDR